MGPRRCRSSSSWTMSRRSRSRSARTMKSARPKSSTRCAGSSRARSPTSWPGGRGSPGARARGWTRSRRSPSSSAATPGFPPMRSSVRPSSTAGSWPTDWRSGNRVPWRRPSNEVICTAICGHLRPHESNEDSIHMIQAQDDARAYARIRYRLLLIGLEIGAVFLAGVQWSGASSALGRWWADVTPAAPLQLAGYLAVFGSAYYVVTLPLHVYGSFILEHRFGLSRLTRRGWLIRELKQVAVSALISVLALEGLYAMLRHLPSSWPLWAAVGWVAVNIILARIFPTVLLPIFYKTSPLQHHELVTRLLELCERAGLPALGVFRFNLGAETRKANAALAGLGRTRRVLLADTLLEDRKSTRLNSSHSQ